MRLFSRVVIVMLRRTRFFYPCRQKLQIKKVGRLDGRSAHHVHLLEAEWKATLRYIICRRSDLPAASHTVLPSRAQSRLLYFRNARTRPEERSRDLIRSPPLAQPSAFPSRSRLPQPLHSR